MRDERAREAAAGDAELPPEDDAVEMASAAHVLDSVAEVGPNYTLLRSKETKAKRRKRQREYRAVAVDTVEVKARHLAPDRRDKGVDTERKTGISEYSTEAKLAVADSRFPCFPVQCSSGLRRRVFERLPCARRPLRSSPWQPVRPLRVKAGLYPQLAPLRLLLQATR